MSADASRFNGKSISAALLARWALGCKRATANGYVSWIQLDPEGMAVSMIGPAGDRAELPFRWDELYEAQTSLSPNTIDEIIATLRRNLKIISPAGLHIPVITNDGLVKPS